MPRRGHRKSQQQERSQTPENNRNTAISTRPEVPKSRDNTQITSRTTQEQLTGSNAETRLPVFGQGGIPFRTDISYIDEAKLRTMEEVIAHAIELSRTGSPYVDPVTDMQVEIWNRAWGTSLKRNTLKSAMDRFQEFKASFASPEPWIIDNEDSDPITKLICLCRNMMTAEKYSDVFNMVLEEATELYERFHVDTEHQLHQDLSVATDDATLANYAVAAKLLTRWNMYNAEWANFAGWCLGEISLRKDAGAWSGPTNSVQRSGVIPQWLAADLEQWETAFGNEPAQESSALSEQNGALDASMHVLRETSGRGVSSTRPTKRPRENDEESSGDFGGYAVSAKRQMTRSDHPRTKPARVTSALHERFGISPMEQGTRAGSLDTGRPENPLANRSSHPTAEIADESTLATQQYDVLPIQSQPEIGISDKNYEECHEEVQDHAPAREISPFFIGEQDLEL